jgi:hypothetical protein
VRVHYIYGEAPYRRQLLGHLKGNAPDICTLDDYTVWREVQESYSSHLRWLVNAWIDTGRTGELSEDPRQRNLLRGGQLPEILERWAADNPATIEIHRINCELILHFPENNAFLVDGPDRLLVAHQAAVRRFVIFLNSSDKFLLCRCRRCEKYYYLRRIARAPLEYGTYCSACRNNASAKRSYDKKVNRIEEKREKVARKALADMPKRLKTREQREEFIKLKVNNHFQHGKGRVPLTWVKRFIAKQDPNPAIDRKEDYAKSKRA